jgi:hypothetical protein
MKIEISITKLENGFVLIMQSKYNYSDNFNLKYFMPDLTKAGEIIQNKINKGLKEEEDKKNLLREHLEKFKQTDNKTDERRAK